MVSEEGRRSLGCSIAVLIVLMAVSPVFLAEAIEFSSDLNVGPYVDRVVYKTVEDGKLALLSGEIDFIYRPTGYDEELAEDPNVEVTTASVRNGYGHLTINCGKYPLNISAFRRAFALAYDKSRVIEDVWNGFGQEHDSLLPYPCSWCIEDEMPYHYYTAQPDDGNALLDRAGFNLDPVTGYRLAPDGTPFNVVIEYPANNFWGASVALIGVDALLSLHVNADTRGADFYEMMTRLDMKGDFDIIMYATQWTSDTVEWLAYEYWSEYADTVYQNPCRFANETYDSWRDQLLHSTDYEEVYEAASAMQMILQENVPRLVAYVNQMVYAYRTDKYDGVIYDVNRGPASQWTLRKAHRIDGTSGGSVYIQLVNPETMNIFLYGSLYAGELLINLYPSLYSRAPDMSPWPYIATDVLFETHDDNSRVPVGHTRITIETLTNATWSDGVLLTAEDVAFTYTYLLESMSYGNTAGAELRELVAAYALSPSKLVLEFGTESYWHFENFAYEKLIPKHIFNDVDGIGYQGWNQWNPVFDPAHPHVTSGPFLLTDVVLGEFFEYTANPDFCYYPQAYTNTTTTSTCSTTTTTAVFNTTLAVVGGAISSAAVILLGARFVLREV